MTPYNHSITLIVSIDHLETAKRISRALDPDVGGYAAFQQRVMIDGIERAIYTTPCTATFACDAAMLIAAPAELHALCAADYAARWPDLDCPDIADVEAFCADVQCFVDSFPDEIILVKTQEISDQVA